VAYAPHTADTRTDRKAVEPSTASIRATKGGVLVKWGVVGGAALAVLGWGWNYADGRWNDCEAAVQEHAKTARTASDRLLILEQQASADRQRADERHADLRSQLSQIQAQLAQIQADLRRGTR
jgi:hypothetical protein